MKTKLETEKKISDLEFQKQEHISDIKTNPESSTSHALEIISIDAKLEILNWLLENSNTTVIFMNGFKVDNVLYGWNNKELYKLPYTDKNIRFSSKKLIPYKSKYTTYYTINNKRMSITKLVTMTTNFENSITVEL